METNEKKLTSLLQNPKDQQPTYIDFWASWCAPCISEFIKSDKIIETYKNRGVKFLYVSIDQDYDKWRIFKERYGLNNEEHLIIGNQAEIIKKYEIKRIPRYMMISSNGKLLKDAPRPSTPEFKELMKNELVNDLAN